MTLNREIDALKRLAYVHKELNAKTLDGTLTDLSFFERSSKLFEPLIESNVKVNDNLKELEKGIKQQNMPSVLESENRNRIPEVRLTSKKSFTEETGGNSWFKLDKDGNYYMACDKTETPRFKAIDGKIIFSKDNNDCIVDVTEGLSELLFVKEFDKTKVRKEDVEQYYRLYGQLGVKEGNSKRARQIHKSFPSIDREHFIKGGTGLEPKVPRHRRCFNMDKTIPDTLEGIRDRIQVLLASKSFGQENVNTELSNLIKYLQNKNERLSR